MLRSSWQSALCAREGRLRACLAVALVGVSACLAGPAHALSKENPGGTPGTAEVVARYYLRDPEVTFWSFAAQAIVGGCPMTFIGPNITVSAAHCGAKSELVGFEVYRKTSPPFAPEGEQIRCEALYQTFDVRPWVGPFTDLVLHYCPPLPSGLNPGDKYGYIDLDTDPVVVGAPIYSVWTHDVNSLGMIQARLYSPGEVTKIDADFYGYPRGVEMDAWAAQGGSGSVHINPTNSRIWVGPLSTGFGGDGAAYRKALSMRDYLSFAVVDAGQGNPANLNVAEISSHGLNPADYDGATDKNGNWLFDVQEDIERVYGEGQRDHLQLGFESERRNNLWIAHPRGVTFHPRDAQVDVHVASASSTPWVLMRHEKLNLKPNTTYRISLMTFTRSAGSVGALQLQLFDPQSFAVTQAILDTRPSVDWVEQAFELRSGSRPPVLRFRAVDAVDMSLAWLSVIETGSVMDFDIQDKRLHWRNDDNGLRAFIVPNGRGSGVDWAGYVGRDRTVTGTGWPLRNRQLAFVKNHSYRVCFWARRADGGGYGFDWATARLKSTSQGGAQSLTTITFNPGNDWTHHCLPRVTVPTSDNMLQFGIPAFRGSRLEDGYLVDDITIEEG
jgi:hypothetical protein